MHATLRVDATRDGLGVVDAALRIVDVLGVALCMVDAAERGGYDVAHWQDDGVQGEACPVMRTQQVELHPLLLKERVEVAVPVRQQHVDRMGDDVGRLLRVWVHEHGALKLLVHGVDVRTLVHVAQP